MDTTLIQRYQSGGDIYQTLAKKYGTPAADSIAAAAMSGDETQINDALVKAKYGAPLDTSTTDIFTNQMLTDPLAAPLADANKVFNNSILSFLKNPTVLLVVGVILFFVFGGGDFIRRKMKGN